MADARARRSPEEVRYQITRAARELFEAQGYESTTTRQVATRAGVIHASVFRHFASKAQLFEEVVLEPLLDFIDGFVEQWADDQAFAAQDPQAIRNYVSALFELVERNKTLFAMLASAHHRPEVGYPGRRTNVALGRHLAALEKRILEVVRPSDDVMDMAVAVRFNIALVLGLVLFENTLALPAGRKLTSDRMVDEVAAYVTRGAIINQTQPAPRRNTVTVSMLPGAPASLDG